MHPTPLSNGTGGGLSVAEIDPAAKILAVDDDPANLLALEAMLTDLGQPVVCAGSGEEALRHLLKDDFAVILLDVLMPGMDGYETAALIRGRDKTRHVPIIFLSAMNKEPAHLERGYNAGAVDFVFKPIDPLILRSKVAVFVELQKRAQEIRRQAALEKRLMADNLLVRNEQRRTEQALQRSLVQQSLVIGALPVMLYVASAADGFRSRRFVGGQLDALIGDGADASVEPFGWLDRVHPEDLPRILDSFDGSGPPADFSGEYRLRCQGGQYRWFSDRATLSRDNPQEQFGMLLDISDRRLLEQQLVHAQKMEAIGEMTGGVAHDFNNMLSVIIGSLDRVLSKPLEDAKARSRLDLALQAARSCADLTKRLLGFARRQALDPRRINLSAELERLREMVLRLVGRTIEVEMSCGKELWPVYVDGSQLEAAVINLVINARDAMSHGGRLIMSAKNRSRTDPALPRLGLKRCDYVELAIADTGAGMPPDVRARAFEPFFTTKEAGKGTGLGLSTIYGFVQQSGGTVAIESEVGMGTTVSLYLPKAPARTEREGAGGRGRPAAHLLAGCRVMVVEDEERLRELARSMLEEMGCETAVADSGEAALRQLESGVEISLLFTDCMMPGRLDGPALAMEARRRYPQLPVLFTSGVRGGVETIGRDRSSVAFLPKPYTSQQLRGAIRALLDGQR
jgi:signal transduction histidine kinase